MQIHEWSRQVLFRHVFVFASYVTFFFMVLGYIHSGLNNYFWGEASDTVSCCQGGLLFFIDVHMSPVGAVCGEVAVVVFIECTLMAA